ncbi:MAG: polyketide cyclase [Nocardioides sp.]|nr:polyketide cyclase [Nocardioides sp.]
MRATYVFGGRWVVPGTPEQVRDVVVDLERYPEWWPQVLAVGWLGPDTGLVLCRSRLPYVLELVLHAVSRDLPVLEVDVEGDLRGTVRWRLEAVSSGPFPRTALALDQRVEVRGALAVASVVGRPLLRWNHARMMDGCAAGLARRTGGG